MKKRVFSFLMIMVMLATFAPTGLIKGTEVFAAAKVSSISVKSKPTKIKYKVGDKLATKGLKLTVKYSNNTKKTVKSGFTCSPTKLSKAGTQKITVKYKGKKTSFSVTVSKAVKSIKIKSKPAKLSYKTGEKLNTAGLKLTVTYTDKSTATVTSGFTCTPTALSTVGTQKITVKYQGKSVSFNVTVKKKTTTDETVSKNTAAVGEVIEYKGATYYWKRPTYTSLVCLQGGKEKVVFKTSKMSNNGKKKYSGYEKIAGAGNRLYFVVKDQGNNRKLCSVKLDGSNFKEYDVKKYNKTLGQIIGISPDKKNIQIVIVDSSSYYEQKILDYYYYLNIQTDTISLIQGSKDVADNANDIWFHNGEIFYIVYNESKRTIGLYKSGLDGSNKIKLGTFKTPRYEFDASSPVVSQAMYPVIDGKKYIYFSYGTIAGTGLFYGSSRVARARLDGGESKIIDTSRDDSTGSLFFVNKNGSVRFLNKTLVYDELFTSHYWAEDGIYVMNADTGKSVKVLSRAEINQKTKSFPKYSLSALSAEIVGNKAYVLLESTSEGNTMHDIIVNGGVMLEKNLKSGTVKVIYKY